MKFTKISLLGAWLIEPTILSDKRGSFRRHFCFKEYATHGMDSRVSQANISENPYKYTLRGFHYQLPPHEEAKTISCLSGSIYDIIVDLRPGSDTYLKWCSVTLSSLDRTSLYVPAGCANAYLTLEENTIVHYYMSEAYEPDSYRGFHFEDPFFEFTWPCAPRLISDKDESLPFYNPS